MPRLAALAPLALALVPAAAAAQPDLGGHAAELAIDRTSGDMRASTRDWLVGTPGWDVGGELRFITSDLGLVEGRALKLTDVGLVRARVRYTGLQRVEAFAAVDALAKQPAYSDAGPLQGLSAGLKIAVSPKWALAASTTGGPTLGVDGLWGTAATAVVFRAHPDETLSFQATAGGDATALRFDAARDEWLAEATAGGQVMFHAPNGIFGSWLGASLAVPVASSSGLEPNTRLDVTIGSVYAVAKDWDVYAEGAIVDRGDAGMAATMLPILDGGFDQRQLTIGVVYRMERKPDRPRDALALE